MSEKRAEREPLEDEDEDEDEGDEAPESKPERPSDAAPRAAKPAEEPRNFWEFLKRTYCSADPRSLGLMRIALGLLLIGDLARRFPDLEAHYSNSGWLSNHFMLFRPMSSHLFSIYLAFNTLPEVRLLWAAQIVIYGLFTLGYRTRVMHVLSFLLLVSINSRNIAVENGGWVVLTLLTLWTMFLPLGRRFSLDSLLASLRARREGTEAALNDRSAPLPDSAPVVSLAVAVLILQWVAIYYFNVVHKTGSQWRDGTAVHYFFQQDRMVTAFGAAIRDHMPLWGIKLMTYGALLTEASVTVLLISPFATKHLRMIAWALVCALHLSIDAVVQLGPFSYAMMTVFFALIPRQFWDYSESWLKLRRPEARVEFNPQSGFALWVCRLLKRFDGQGKLTFAADAETKGIAVSRSGQRRLGVRGLRLAAESFALPWLARALLHVPGLPRLLRRGFSSSGKAAAYLELEGLPGIDQRAAEPAPIRQHQARVLGWARELSVATLIVACGSQVLIENRAVPPWLKPEGRPEWMTALVIYPRLFQGWSMFAPSPPVDDGRVVVDGVTKDGRKLDPLTGLPPSFDVQPEGGFRMNQIWGDFHRRIHEERFEAYWDGFREYLRNYHQRSGHAEDELVSFDAYYVSEQIPPPGLPHPPAQRRKLFSYGDTARGQPQKDARKPGP